MHRHYLFDLVNLYCHSHKEICFALFFFCLFFIWHMEKKKVGEKRGCFTDEPIGQDTNRNPFLFKQKYSLLQFTGPTLCTFHSCTCILSRLALCLQLPFTLLAVRPNGASERNNCGLLEVFGPPFYSVFSHHVLRRLVSCMTDVISTRSVWLTRNVFGPLMLREGNVGRAPNLPFVVMAHQGGNICWPQLRGTKAKESSTAFIPHHSGSQFSGLVFFSLFPNLFHKNKSASPLSATSSKKKKWNDRIELCVLPNKFPTFSL